MKSRGLEIELICNDDTAFHGGDEKCAVLACVADQPHARLALAPW